MGELQKSSVVRWASRFGSRCRLIGIPTRKAAPVHILLPHHETRAHIADPDLSRGVDATLSYNDNSYVMKTHMYRAASRGKTLENPWAWL